MRDFFKSLKFKLILGLIAVLLGTMIFTVNQAGTQSLSSRAANAIASPFRYLSAKINDFADSKVGYIVNSGKNYEENQKLQAEVEELRNQLVDYENTKNELSELQKFIGIKEEHADFKLSPPCKVVSYITNDPFYSFIIDRGTHDGISLHDPVVTSAGLVGAVTEVSEKSCTVTSILSPELSISVKPLGKNDPGILEGSSDVSSSGLTKIIHLEKTSSIKKGDNIITTGNGGLFPADYLVGKVTKVGNAPNGISAYAVIEPFADIRKLTDVMVVTSFEGKGAADEH